MFSSRFIDPTTDFGFKRLFGQEDSKEILKHFLVDILRLPHPIQELRYLPTEQLPAAPDDRVSVYDIYCTDTTGKRFIIEMQRNWQVNYKERSLYYSTFPISQQSEKGGGWAFELLPVYCISVMRFRMDDQPTYMRRVQLVDTDNGKVFYNKLVFVFIELPKFDLPPEQLSDPADKWIYLLKYMPSLEDIPADLDEEPFVQAFAIAEQAAMSPEERWQYETSLKHDRDAYAVVESARLRGEEQGRVAERRAMVRSMLAEGLPVAMVSKITGLDAEELALLAQTTDAEDEAEDATL